MKLIKRKFTSSLTLFILLSTSQLASAFYEPSLGRWINRDPVEEIAFQNQTRRHRSADYFHGNLHWCMVNDPVNKVDSWGLEITFVGCSEDDKDNVEKALKDNCDKAKLCAGCHQGAGGVNNICSDNPDIFIFCRDSNWVSPSGEKCSQNCGISRRGLPDINLCEGYDDPNKCGPNPIGCTVLHEAMHTGGEPDGPTVEDFERCMGCK